MIILLLILGIGLSVLITELSVGFEDPGSLFIGGGIFAGYCVALLVGHYNTTIAHAQLKAVMLYFTVVCIGTALNMAAKNNH